MLSAPAHPGSGTGPGRHLRHRAQSDAEGQTIGDLAQTRPSVQPLIEWLADQWLHISSSLRNQLTPEMMDAADKVIVMAERETWPEYLAEGGKVVSWKIDDPAGVSPDEMQVIMEQLKCKVRELVQEVG